MSVGTILVLGLLGLASAAPQPATTSSRAPADYARADAETIRAQVEDICADPSLATHKTLWQWLREKLARWEGPHLSQGLSAFLWWAIVIWCVLTLLAILAHLVWTIWLLVRPLRSSPAAALRAGVESYENATFEQLWERSAALARAGAYRDATGLLLLALLRRLDAWKILRFHKSKTNGEYLREYPSRGAGRSQFTQFILAFERSIYGGAEVAGPAYETMSTLAQQVLSNASQQPQI